MQSTKKKFNIRTLVLMGLFTGIIVLLGATPLGIIPIGPVGLTTVHIPVIIGALMLGPKYGALLGFIFGIVSLLVATFQPFVGAFAFSPFAPGLAGYTGNPLSLVVCFVPRILIGLVTPLVFNLLVRLFKNRGRIFAYGGAALAGTLTNTILVLTFIYLFFGPGYAEAIEIAHSALLAVMGTTILTQGVPESIAAVLVAMALGKVIDSYRVRSLGQTIGNHKDVPSTSESIDTPKDK